MDLSIIINDTKLKIRVAGILRTPRGFLFEKSDKGYIFTVGGKVMINETSQEAIKREIMEEIGMKVENLILYSVMENFYKTTLEKVHEICFVYKIENIFDHVIPDGFIEVPTEDISKYDIRPNHIVDIMGNKNILFKHFIIK